MQGAESTDICLKMQGVQVKSSKKNTQVKNRYLKIVLKYSTKRFVLCYLPPLETMQLYTIDYQDEAPCHFKICDCRQPGQL